MSEKGREEVRARVEKLGRKGRREGGRIREKGEVRRGKAHTDHDPGGASTGTGH